jgi:hypothetical protein
MGDVLSTIGDALGTAFQMAWEVWWALILGILVFDGTTYFFCSAGCKEEFQTKPEHYARHAHGTRGGRPRGILRPRT